MKVIIFLFCLISVYTLTAQNVGVNQNSPTNSLHISPVNIGDNPLRIDGIQSYSVGDTSLLMINTNSGIVKYINPADFVSIISGGAGLGTDNQNIDSLILNGYNLTTFITNGYSSSVDLSPLSDSISNSIINNSLLENQIISVLYDNADTLLYNSSFINSLRDSIDTDIDSLTLNNTTLTIYENGGSASVDLSSLSDNDADPTNELQTISKSGSTVTLSNGGGSFTDDDTQLTETQVDGFVNNNGYLTSFTEVDGSVTNEIELPTGGSNGQILSTNGSGTYSWINDNSGSDNQNISGSSFNATTGNLVIGIQNGTNQTVNFNSLKDHDWYEVGGTTAPNSINDNIFTQGNVGIKNTTPTSSLSIGNHLLFDKGLGNVSVASDIFMSAQGLIASESNLFFNTDSDGNNTGNFYFSKGTETSSATKLVTILNSGNVGINTTSPSAKLEIIESTTQNALTIQKDFTGLANTNAAFIGGTDVGFTTTGIYVLQKDNASFVGPNTNTFNVVNNSSSQFVVKGAGNVGIGTLAPVDKLQVNGHLRVGLVNPPNTGTYPDYGNRVYFSGGPVGGTGNSEATDVLWMARYNELYDRSQLRINIGDNNAGDDALHIGKILSGQSTFTTDFILSNNGQAYKSGGGTWATTSDRRTKKDIVNFSDGLNVLSEINPVTFKYNGQYNTNDDGKDYVGIIAQDVQKVAPYMIGSYNATKTSESKVSEEILNYDGGTYMLYVLVNSVKEQQKQIEELKESNNNLLKQLEKLNKD